MSVGEALAEARYRAGLSVDEVSERTKIREAVIRGIEQDDYDACGGDLYVRGYVRAIAGAVGIDAQPLIREYELGRGDAPRTSGIPGTADTVTTAADARLADSVLPITRPEPILPSSAAPEPALSGAPPTADTAAGPAAATAAPDGAARARGRRRTMVLLAAVALVVLGGASGLIALSLNHGQGESAAPGAAARSAQAARRDGAVQQGSGTKLATQATQAAKPSAAAATPAKAAPAKASAKARVRPLPIASAAAFGPGGVTDGDNPQSALFAITPGSPLPWQSHWYATPHFGLLKSGTGLLLDMGRKVTITDVRIVLAPYSGADLQLRVGDAAVPARLTVAARTVDVGGSVWLRLRSPVRARYLLIWFTQIPPNGSEQYQASVYRVVVSGRY